MNCSVKFFEPTVSDTSALAALRSIACPELAPVVDLSPLSSPQADSSAAKAIATIAASRATARGPDLMSARSLGLSLRGSDLRPRPSPAVGAPDGPQPI